MLDSIEQVTPKKSKPQPLLSTKKKSKSHKFLHNHLPNSTNYDNVCNQIHKKLLNQNCRFKIKQKVCQKKNHGGNQLIYLCIEPDCQKKRIGCMCCMISHKIKNKSCKIINLFQFIQKAKEFVEEYLSAEVNFKKSKQIITKINDQIEQLINQFRNHLLELKRKLFEIYQPTLNLYQSHQEQFQIIENINNCSGIFKFSQTSLTKIIRFIYNHNNPVHHIKNISSSDLEIQWGKIKKNLHQKLTYINYDQLKTKAHLVDSTLYKAQVQSKKLMIYRQNQCKYDRRECLIYFECCNMIYCCMGCHNKQSNHLAIQSKQNFRICLSCQMMFLVQQKLKQKYVCPNCHKLYQSYQK